MAETTVAPVRLPDDKPPRWANSLMRWALTTRGIDKMVGKDVALLTFTGRRTGTRYTIPVSYHRDGDTVSVITKKQRRWWDNFEAPAAVGVRLAGRDYTGKAQIEIGEGRALDFMTEYLRKQPVDAMAYGLGKDEIARDTIASIVPHIVAIRIAVTPVG